MQMLRYAHYFVLAGVALLVLETLVEYRASLAPAVVFTDLTLDLSAGYAPDAAATAALPPLPAEPTKAPAQPKPATRRKRRPTTLLAEPYAGAPSTFPGSRFEDLAEHEVQAKQWLVFQQSGGFNNQRIILERALRICKLLKRTCLVPPAGRHSSMFKNYNRLDADEIIAMDRVLDFGLLQDYQEAVPSALRFEDTLPILQKAFPESTQWHVIEQSRAERKKTPLGYENITALAANPASVIYIAGPTMWQRFAPGFDEEVHPYIRYAPFFRAISLDLARSLRLGRHYICVHSRPSDHGEKWEARMANNTPPALPMEHSNAAAAAAAAAAATTAANVTASGGSVSHSNTVEGGNSSAINVPTAPPTPKVRHANGFSTKYLPSDDAIADPGTYLQREIWLAIAEAGLDANLFRRVYIATKPNINRQLFANITAGRSDMRVYLSGDMPPRVSAALAAVFPRPEQVRLQNDILGIVEQLICARAFVYIGFSGSSFSEYIARMRREPMRNLIVGELGQVW
ncbi:Hypothetical Protein FCC1311_104262 [Hondaea fermentalgiana]|uniref:O-fucosyltransferase family protein n=1 Tax=Hondaea fermentalgiana TaxID=2315210 RepID=A0A2R5GTL4_9STRA|nr:Hypothetical Protein FCC1311_104262 [Hondaea fermentalgiana]|eukprot:GBG34202.1 Hypothetical Protein FCC1311_104262 [Hondaea fermentalgiana]